MKLKVVFSALTAAVVLSIMSIGASAASGVPVDSENFPDETFRSIVSENFDTDKNGLLSSEEAVRKLYCDECDITSLKGIEYFTELEELEC